MEGDDVVHTPRVIIDDTSTTVFFVEVSVLCV